MGIYPFINTKFVKIVEIHNRFKTTSMFIQYEDYWTTYDMCFYDEYTERKILSKKIKLYNLPIFGFEDDLSLYNFPIDSSAFRHYGGYAVKYDEGTIYLMKLAYKILLNRSRLLLT
jgi:hypothetical protein